ncbi:hypothetical protein RIF29_20288 [Crotalaria pallida]|uniref:Uncharacterized protein n=1 Tax=Crotalaria pallida TaxID=3830 RepID=A0AAN9I8J1_CROPI
MQSVCEQFVFVISVCGLGALLLRPSLVLLSKMLKSNLAIVKVKKEHVVKVTSQNQLVMREVVQQWVDRVGLWWSKVVDGRYLQVGGVQALDRG